MSRGAQMMKRVLGISTITLLIGGAEGLVAQRQGTLPSGAGRRNDMEVRVQARFDNLVREQLELGDDQWRQLQAAVEDFRARRLEFSRGERNTRARVGRLGGPGGGPGGGRELTEQEALGILAEMLELSDSEATLVREEQEALLRILSAQQLVRYFMMRQQQGDMVLRIRGRGGPGRGRQGGGGGGRAGRGGAGGR